MIRTPRFFFCLQNLEKIFGETTATLQNKQEQVMGCSKPSLSGSWLEKGRAC